MVNRQFLCGHLCVCCVEAVQHAMQVQHPAHVVPTAEVAEKEGSKLLGRQEYAKRVALDLYRFMEARTLAAHAAVILWPLSYCPSSSTLF